MRTHHIFIIALAGSLNIETGFGQNLLQNGNFESGSAGWTTWTGDWGSGHAWDFNNAEGGQFGTAALKLSINGEKSFGVYQEVPVTPGTAYRLDAYWTGQKFGDDTWYEIILLDGPWDPFQADSGGDVVYTNFMYGYDSNTYPLPGDFGWVWAHEQNDSPVDWMDRNGVRTATGDTMTVVLRPGAAAGRVRRAPGSTKYPFCRWAVLPTIVRRSSTAISRTA